MPDTASPPPRKQGKRLTMWVFLTFAGVLTLLVLIGLRLLNTDAQPLQLGEKPAGFALTTFEGEVIHSTDLEGKVVLVNFWASWCTTCDTEAILLEQAWRHYQAEDGADRVMFLGVAYMDTENAAQAYLNAHGVTFPNGQDLRGAISRIYQVTSVPETFILDGDGVLRAFKLGPFTSLAEIQTAIDEVLNQAGS